MPLQAFFYLLLFQPCPDHNQHFLSFFYRLDADIFACCIKFFPEICFFHFICRFIFHHYFFFVVGI